MVIQSVTASHATTGISLPHKNRHGDPEKNQQEFREQYARARGRGTEVSKQVSTETQYAWTVNRQSKLTALTPQRGHVAQVDDLVSDSPARWPGTTQLVRTQVRTL